MEIRDVATNFTEMPLMDAANEFSANLQRECHRNSVSTLSSTECADEY